MERIDYYQLYCNFSDEAFVQSLGLQNHEAEALSLLTEQCSESNRCYIPQLHIEALVGDSGTPYQALRALHSLKQQRIIFYGLAEEVPTHPASNPAEITDTVVDKALEQIGVEQEQPTPGFLTEIKRKKSFERYAVLNVEYPVVFHCLNEEGTLREESLVTDRQLLYTAIRTNKVLMGLAQCGYPAIMEFLHYMQSLFNQPLSVDAETEQSPSDAAFEKAQAIVNKEYNDWENGSQTDESE